MLNKQQHLYPLYFSQIAFQYQLRSSQAVFSELSNISAKTLLLMSVCLDLNNTNYQTGNLSFNNNSKRNLSKPNSLNSHNNSRPVTVVSGIDNWFVASFTDSASKHSYQNIEGKRFNLFEGAKPYISAKTTLDNVAKASSFKQLRSASEGTKSIAHLKKETKNHEEINSSTRFADISNHSVADKLAPLARDNVEAEAKDNNVNSVDLVVEAPNIKQAFDSNIAQSSVDADAVKQVGGVGGALYHDGNLVKNPIIVLEVSANCDILDGNEIITTIVADEQNPIVVSEVATNYDNLDENEVTTAIVAEEQVEEEIVERDVEIVAEQREIALPEDMALSVSVNYDISQESAEDPVKPGRPPILPPIDNIKKQKVFSLPGKVVEICVNKGQYVAKGNVLFVIEMMKMELKIGAECDGVITDIFIEQGDEILSMGQVLFELTESE